MSTRVIHHGPSNAPSDAKFALPPDAGSVVMHSNAPVPVPGGGGGQTVSSMGGVRTVVTQVQTPPEALAMMKVQPPVSAQALPPAPAPEAAPQENYTRGADGTTVVHFPSPKGGGLAGLFRVGAGWLLEGKPGKNFIRHPSTGTWTSQHSLKLESERLAKINEGNEEGPSTSRSST